MTPRFKLLKIIIPKFALFFERCTSKSLEFDPQFSAEYFPNLLFSIAQLYLFGVGKLGLIILYAFGKVGHKLLTRFEFSGCLTDTV